MSGPEHPEESINRLAAELGDCRQRGLDRLDVDTSPQKRVDAPALEQLAHHYCKRRSPRMHGRIAEIKRLLDDALGAYAQRGNESDAQLIRELFFPDPTISPTPGPGEMLKAAKIKSGLDEKRFAEHRRRIMGVFAEFLLVFAHEKPDFWPRWRRVIITAAVLVLLVTAAVSVWLSARNPGDVLGGSSTTGPTTATTTTNPPPEPGSTKPQTVNSGPEPGARTFLYPAKLNGEGPRIDNHATVEVSCKIAAPSAGSVGTYWYRIASQPWNNQYYAPANSFLNGDPVGGPYTHDVDENVPNCPP